MCTILYRVILLWTPFIHLPRSLTHLRQKTHDANPPLSPQIPAGIFLLAPGGSHFCGSHLFRDTRCDLPHSSVALRSTAHFTRSLPSSKPLHDGVLHTSLFTHSRVSRCTKVYRSCVFLTNASRMCFVHSSGTVHKLVCMHVYCSHGVAVVTMTTVVVLHRMSEGSRIRFTLGTSYADEI